VLILICDQTAESSPAAKKFTVTLRSSGVEVDVTSYKQVTQTSCPRHTVLIAAQFLVMGRVVRYLMPLTTVLVAATALLPRTVESAALQPLYSLTALLSVAPDLSGLSKHALLAETERIWRREGVKLVWPATSAPEFAAPLRVLVITRREALARGDRERWAVGELVPQTGQRALAIASIAGAERVLVEADARRLQLLESRESADYRLGLVLGRAVAHEIGHYLLATKTHADRGLMRAAIDAREFADPGARTFTLDEAAGDWLRHRLTQTTDGSLPSSGFSYGQIRGDSSSAPRHPAHGYQ
jgi:hypothetical protein